MRLRLRGWAAAALPVLVMVRSLSAGELTITILDAEAVGEVRGMVFRDQASFDRRADPVAKFAQSSENGRVVVHVPDLPAGRYAVASFQDRNGNQRLDKTMIGQPTEPYGFSNDARGVMAPPAFDQAAFDVTGAPRAIAFHLR